MREIKSQDGLLCEERFFLKDNREFRKKESIWKIEREEEDIARAGKMHIEKDRGVRFQQASK